MAIRIVHVEDDRYDREIIANLLRAERVDCVIEAVDSPAAFTAALSPPPDLILSDFSMPHFDGARAQELARAHCPDVPFVFVSGSIGEERAVDSLRNGATDYVLKDHLEKLPTAVKRALDEADNRRRRAAAEAALRQLNAELETRIDERTRALMDANAALKQARREADRANQAKSDFLSRMSHELRTPLNAILGFAQLLESDAVSTDQAESVTHIMRGGKHLLNLINEVLDIARIEAGHLSLSLEPVAAGEVIDEVTALIQPLAAQRGIRVEAAVAPCAALADRQRLSQVLLNLASNAVKYNRHEGSVRVEARQEEHRVIIEVSDTGPGIPADKMPLLFTPFERLGAEISPIEGTGLGLTLARHLTEAMEGTLSVTSVVDQGTTFRLSLPAAAAAPETAADTRATLPDARPVSGSVLYIEDNASNAQLMRRILQRRPGARLECAPDGRSGLTRLAADAPDLVILDLHLSDMSGEIVIEQVMSNPATRQVPVAVLSADATSATRQRLLAAGAYRYLTKPYDIADILQLVDDVLGRAS